MLAPLTKIMHSKVKFKWNKIKQEAFKEIKRIVARNVLSSYPGIIKEFKIHTDDRDFQLGAVISHNGEPMALYGRKLTIYPIRYNKVTEKELLRIFENYKKELYYLVKTLKSILIIKNCM